MSPNALTSRPRKGDEGEWALRKSVWSLRAPERPGLAVLPARLDAQEEYGGQAEGNHDYREWCQDGHVLTPKSLDRTLTPSMDYRRRPTDH